MPFERKLAVGRFDGLFVGCAGQAEDFVVVLFLALFQCDLGFLEFVSGFSFAVIGLWCIVVCDWDYGGGCGYGDNMI